MENLLRENQAVNTIRLLAVDAVQKANSGHPGMPMGCAPIAHLLFTKIMKHNPNNSKWINRDRFILSAGHGSTLLYSMLHLSGYGLTIEDLKNFRQWGSLTPGHPEFGWTNGVETTTGPLGQGVANAVGMAISSKYFSAKYNKADFELFNNKVYAIAGDGCLMEGISHEACSLAGHLKLDNLVLIYDNNTITIEGHTNLSCSDDAEMRFKSYGWEVLKVNDVNDLEDLNNKLETAKKHNGSPLLIIVNTVIGYGSPNKKNTHAVHGSPLGPDEVKATKEFLGFPTEESFYVPQEVKDLYKAVAEKNQKVEEEWNSLFELYKSKYPELAAEIESAFSGEVSEEWLDNAPKFEFGTKVATRSASGKVLNVIAKSVKNLIGGSADLSPSTNTFLEGLGSFLSENYAGRNFHFGIREHAMGSILNAMCMYGGIIPFGATFFVFCDYLRPVIRIAALSHISPKYVFTHDSIGVGEDGPTHQPIEHLASLRSIPNTVTIRPSDGNETIFAWKAALAEKHKPVSIILTRQNLLNIDRNTYAKAENLEKGAYILKDSTVTPDVILMASGSEVGLIVEAEKELTSKGLNVRIVSFPSWELFDAQSSEYKESVLPKNVTKRISVEAGRTMGWERYTTTDGLNIGIDKFGASAPAEILFEKYELTVNNIVEKALELVK